MCRRPCMDALPVQLIAQLACTHEGMFQVQVVDPAHQRQIGRADRLGQVVDRPPADVEQAGLACDAEFVVTVDHGFALSNPALVSACSKKSFSIVIWPILGLQLLLPGQLRVRRRRMIASNTTAAFSISSVFH